MKHKLNRLARFSIAAATLRQWPDLVRELMRGMIVLEARFDWALDSVCYLADSSIFPENEPALAAPEWFANYRYEDCENGCCRELVELRLGPMPS